MARQSESRIARYEQKSKNGEVGSRKRKGKEKDEMKGKGRAVHNMVGPRAGPSRAARDGHARVPKHEPICRFKPLTIFPHPVQSSPSPGMSIWTPEGLACESRRTAQQP